MKFHLEKFQTYPCRRYYYHTCSYENPFFPSIYCDLITVAYGEGKTLESDTVSPEVFVHSLSRSILVNLHFSPFFPLP